MLARTAWRSGMTHSPNRIRVFVIRAVPLITGRVRCTSQIVACTSSEPPASTSAVSRASNRGWRRSRSTVHASVVAVVSWPAASKVSSSSATWSSEIGEPSS